ncbi:hypothetical protein M5K25_005295 [Dendrobium thyrsiflorum]|uniref:Uncharacterized protein n=1 Tax=Dendrobium thyrsiflorum TaxID=117978 RepID=A0ABD0VHB9_DENTH
MEWNESVLVSAHTSTSKTTIVAYAIAMYFHDKQRLKAAAHAVGEINLEKKFESGTESLRRGIMIANSLYL